MLKVLRFALLLGEDIVLNEKGFAHDLADTVDRLVIHRLVIVGGLVDCQEIQNVLFITLLNEKFVLVLLNDNIPRVEWLGSCHDGWDGKFSCENVCFVLVGKTSHHRVIQGGSVIEDITGELLEEDRPLSAGLVKISIVSEDFSTVDASV
jgi:hypothetical protein